MKTLTFNLDGELDAAVQDAVVNRISNIPGVVRAGYIRPGSKNPMIRRMCFVDLSDGDPKIAQFLQNLDGVEPGSVEAPPLRTIAEHQGQ